MNLYEEFKFKPLLSEQKLVSGYDKLKHIEQEIHKALKDNENFVGVDFCDVGAGGIQIRGHHKSFTRYTYGNQVTINYDYSNADEAIQRFINMWGQQDNSKHNNAYSRFLEMGNEYGWD